MFDFVAGSDLIPDSGHLTGFGIGFSLGFFRNAAVTAPLLANAYGM
jgi:hypothetical protein